MLSSAKFKLRLLIAEWIFCQQTNGISRDYQALRILSMERTIFNCRMAEKMELSCCVS
jgi:hypothetical protein